MFAQGTLFSKSISFPALGMLAKLGIQLQFLPLGTSAKLEIQQIGTRSVRRPS